MRDNLLGTGGFCPVIGRKRALERFPSLALAMRARGAVGQAGGNLVARAAGFMLLADSRPSFDVEGERPSRDRLERWGRAVLQAGRNPLTLDEIIHLHGILIEDTRLVQAGLRTAGVFIGDRDHAGDPLPEFIGARPQGLDDLMAGLLEANDRMRDDGIDPVLQAAATAFGFVYVHPFADGNGRLHRLPYSTRSGRPAIHAGRDCLPGFIGPARSHRRLPADAAGAVRAVDAFIRWRPTPERNVEVFNDTADLDRYFDCNEAAELLYACVQRTVEDDLPREIDYLRRHDEAVRRIVEAVEVPARIAEDLVMFIRQNRGSLPRKRRQRTFRELSDEEVNRVESIVADAFASDVR